jgi:virulence-associated protein VagC
LVKEAITKLKMVSKASAGIHIPDEIVLDEAFPFSREDQKVKIRIEGKKLIIEGEESGKNRRKDKQS